MMSEVLFLIDLALIYTSCRPERRSAWLLWVPQVEEWLGKGRGHPHLTPSLVCWHFQQFPLALHLPLLPRTVEIYSSNEFQYFSCSASCQHMDLNPLSFDVETQLLLLFIPIVQSMHETLYREPTIGQVPAPNSLRSDI